MNLIAYLTINVKYGNQDGILKEKSNLKRLIYANNNRIVIYKL